jgi:hypothetical protein
MGLTNYLKNKLEKHPHTTKALNATKQGATKTYQYAKKAVNSPTLDKIGKASQGIAKGIDQGAGLFNNSLGFGPDVDIGFGYPESRPKNKHKKHRRNANTIIIRHEYPRAHSRHKQHHRPSRRHRKNWQLGDI